MADSCERCGALVADTAKHANFCDRVNDSLPYQPCGAAPPAEVDGYVLAPCHRRAGHPGGHMHDTTGQPVKPRRWRR